MNRNKLNILYKNLHQILYVERSKLTKIGGELMFKKYIVHQEECSLNPICTYN